jgi:hypothetical protein
LPIWVVADGPGLAKLDYRVVESFPAEEIMTRSVMYPERSRSA